MAEAKSRKKKRKSRSKQKSGLAETARDPRKVAGNRVGVMGFVGYESVDIQDSDPKLTLSGPGLGVQSVFELGLTPELSLPLAAGLHYASLSGKADIAAVSVTLMSLIFDGSIAYKLTPELKLGGFLSYDYGIGGSAAFDLGEFGKTSYGIESSSRLAFGPRAFYQLSPMLAVGGDLGLTSGQLKVKPTTEDVAAADSENADADAPAKLSGMNLRFLASYHF